MRISTCCRVPVRVEPQGGGDGRTRYYACTGCGRPCGYQDDDLYCDCNHNGHEPNKHKSWRLDAPGN